MVADNHACFYELGAKQEWASLNRQFRFIKTGFIFKVMAIIFYPPDLQQCS